MAQISLKSLPLISTGKGIKVMDKEGSIFTRVMGKDQVTAEGNYIVTLQEKLLGNVVETVTTIQNGHIGIEPVIVPNKVFMDTESGIYFILAREDNKEETSMLAEKSGCGYIFPAKQDDGTFLPVAYFDGEIAKTPRVLINECGVTYHLIDSVAVYGEICKRTKGYMQAQKVACIYRLPAKVGDKITTVVNGVQEHTTVIEEGEVKVQNPGGEAYKMKEAKLRKSYEYAETTEEGYELWKPKDELQAWTKSELNIICILWGGFEVLVTPLININNPQDVYGCNYQVFYGSDTTVGTHQVRKIFVPMEPITHQLEIRSVLTNGHVRTLDSIPKVDYVEVPDLLRLTSLLKIA